MWLLTTIAENVATALAFYLAMHNSNAHAVMEDFMAAFTPERQPKP